MGPTTVKNTSFNHKFFFAKEHLVLLLLTFICWFSLPDGIYLGGDWGLLATKNQVDSFFHPWTWSTRNFGIPNLIDMLAGPFQSLIYLITKLGLPLRYLAKGLIVVTFYFANYFLYRLFYYWNLSFSSSIVAGLVYVTSPVVFNYTAMGWQFALLAMAIMPFALEMFCKAVLRDDFKYLLIVTIAWTVAALQSQSVVWFMLLFVCFIPLLVKSYITLKTFLFKILTVLFAFVGLNAFWWCALILFKDENIVNSSIILSEVSVGADSPFTAINALRLWGSLFNYQYESAAAISGLYYSWLIPIMAIIALLVSKRRYRKIIISVSLLAFVMPTVYLFLKEHRAVLAMIPGAGLIRQLSRFTVLTAFSYAVIIGILFDNLVKSRLTYKKILITIMLLLLTITTIPWISGELTNTTASMKPGPDFRLRAKEFPSDYYKLEEFLLDIKLHTHALYLPYGMSLSFKDDLKFHGMFKEGIDIFAMYSPIPGIFMPTDRPSPISDYVKLIQNSDNVVNATQLAPINYFILRKNLFPYQFKKMFDHPNLFFPEKFFDCIWQSKNILVFARKNILPLIYSPNYRLLEDGDLQILEHSSKLDAQKSPAIVFTKQNLNKIEVINKLNGTVNLPSNIEFNRINPTKYKLRLTDVKGFIPLVFGESYSQGWRLYPSTTEGIEESSLDKVQIMKKNGNEKSPGIAEASLLEIDDYLRKGWISNIGDKFISKQILGVIQNNNLTSHFMETLFLKALPEASHFKVNGYTNGWLIDIEKICENPTEHVCFKNKNGLYNITLVMEFWPQQAFYFGILISILTLFFLILIYFLAKKRRLRSLI